MCLWTQLTMDAANGGHNDIFVRCCMDDVLGEAKSGGKCADSGDPLL